MLISPSTGQRRKLEKMPKTFLTEPARTKMVSFLSSIKKQICFWDSFTEWKMVSTARQHTHVYCNAYFFLCIFFAGDFINFRHNFT